jgi:hypothetical protein
MDALLIREPFIEQILAGTKTWEIRGNATKKRGLVALVKSGTGTVVGACCLAEVYGPLLWRQFRDNAPKWGHHSEERPPLLPYPDTYGWELAPVVTLAEPVPYTHRPGAVIWAKLDETVSAQVRSQLEGTALAGVADAKASKNHLPIEAAPPIDTPKDKRRARKSARGSKPPTF